MHCYQAFISLDTLPQIHFQRNVTHIYIHHRLKYTTHGYLIGSLLRLYCAFISQNMFHEYRKLYTILSTYPMSTFRVFITSPPRTLDHRYLVVLLYRFGPLDVSCNNPIRISKLDMYMWKIMYAHPARYKTYHAECNEA